MGITSRKTESLTSEPPVTAKPQPLAPPKRAAPKPAVARAHPRQIKLPVAPIEGDPAFIHWRTFREAYAQLAEAAFSKHTVADWRAAESILDEEFEPKFARDLTAEMLEGFELFVVKVGYSRHRIDNMVSRLHHMILWGCECGYLDREAFGLGPDLRWPVRDRGNWAKRRREAAA